MTRPHDALVVGAGFAADESLATSSGGRTSVAGRRGRNAGSPAEVRLAISATDLSQASCDALLLGVMAAPRGSLAILAPGLSARQARQVADGLAAVGAKGRTGEIARIPAPPGFAARTIVGVGLGEGETATDPDNLRQGFGSAVRLLLGVRHVAVAIPAAHDLLEPIALGARLGAYSYRVLRASSLKAAAVPPSRITFLVHGRVTAQKRDIVRRASIVGSAVCVARDLVNTPANLQSPEGLAQSACDAVSGLPVGVRVWDSDDLLKEGCGGILGVGMGSIHPPRLLKLDYSPPGATTHLAVVGKGVTFDSGGISLKDVEGMHVMKSDMAGAAAVIGAMAAVAELGLDVHVSAWLPIAENMPGGSAQRPGDVITAADGTTIEVVNTDAEGRLMLADALALAAREKPDLLVDIASLTGACLMALGWRMSGVMSNSDEARDAVCATASEAGEAVWPMPLPGELRSLLDSTVADIANIGQRPAALLTAGLFLKEFVPDGQPWVHIDMAGPSFNESSAYGYVPVGGTGSGVRTLVALAARMSGERDRWPS